MPMGGRESAGAQNEWNPDSARWTWRTLLLALCQAGSCACRRRDSVSGLYLNRFLRVR